MKITKYGHACLLVEEQGVRFLFDPGTYSPDALVEGVHAILITHNHQDHLDTGLIKQLLEENPGIKIITVAEAGKDLAEAGIPFITIEDGGELEVNGVSVRSFGKKHAYIYGDAPQCQNTVFMVANRFYHPGDSFHVPSQPVEILALPVGGPWMKLSEAVDYAKQVKPKVAIPMHDAFYKEGGMQMVRGFVGRMIEPDGIDFRNLADGESVQLD